MHDLEGRPLRGCREKQVDMLGVDLQSQDFAIQFNRLFPKEPIKVLGYIALQYSTSSPRYPNEVIVKEEYGCMLMSILLSHKQILKGP